MTLSLIAALATNRVIGKNGAIPWHIPEDMRYFKRITTGQPIIMGRKTYDSIGRPLPNRDNIVVTRNPQFSAPGLHVAHSLKDALEQAEEALRGAPRNEVFSIGGARLYADALPQADKLYLTYVHREVEGDTFFPRIDEGAWLETEREDHISAKAETPFSFVVLERV